MAYNRLMSELDQTRFQLTFFFLIILLAIDGLNPVKIFLHVFPQILPWHVATVSGLLFLYVLATELKELLYFGIKVYFNGILSIFFKEVEVIGKDNIPYYGPVIFTGNHRNQFVDALVLMCTCQHKLSPMIAEKSWYRPVVGQLAWAMGCVPVKRAQDSPVNGTGKISAIRNTSKTNNNMSTDSNIDKVKDESEDGDEYPLVCVTGHGTKFTKELKAGDKIRFSGNTGMKVKSVESDTCLYLEENEVTVEFTLPSSETEATMFQILRRVEQKDVYEAVLQRLKEGGTIGIFPEGGSHDRTDLLPLKVGVALIAYSALEKDGTLIPIVPVGLNYFRGHRFRGRAIVEYGAPIYINPNTLKAYKAGGHQKRKVCNGLLQRVEDSMRSVLVTTDDYESMKLVLTARRLYQKKNLNAQEKQDISRRFAEGYKMLVLKAKGNPPQEWLSLQERIVNYQNELSDIGIKDYQVSKLGVEQGKKSDKYEGGDIVMREMRIPYRILKLVFVLLLAFLPTAVLNFPVGIFARMFAEKKRKKALANSKVKIKGLDVMLSERIIFSIVMVPTLWFLYSIFLVIFTDWDPQQIALCILSMPVFSYIGVMTAEAGMVDVNELRPLVKQYFPSTKRRLQRLPEVRKQLQHDLRKFVKDAGPVLGELYYEKNIDWKVIIERTRLMKQKQEVGENEDKVLKTE